MRRRARVFTALGALLEIVLAPLSFLFLQIVRSLMRLAVYVHYHRRRDLALGWSVVSEKALEPPIALPAVMAIGPRWNTHAITARVGPLRVRRSIAIRVKSAEQSAGAWTIVVYTFPRHATVSSVGSLNAPFAEEWTTIDLRPGEYALGLRYFRWKETVELPAVRVDGGETVSAKPVAADNNDFYARLAERGGRFYLCLHYYVWPMLRYREWFPQSFVEKQYLPAGNPETHFAYGALAEGERLALEIDRALLASHDIYVTIYNRASFPILSYQVTVLQHRSPEVKEKCYYLVRIHTKELVERPFDPAWLTARPMVAGAGERSTAVR